MTKQVSFLFVATIAALVYGFVFRLFVRGGGYGYLGVAWLAAFVFLALFVIQVVLVRERTMAFVAIVIQAVVFNIFFIDRLFWWAISAFVLCTLLLWLAYLRGRHRLDNMISLRFFQLRHDVLSRAIIALTLFSIILYMSFVNVLRLTVSRDFIAYFAQPVEYAGQLFIKDFSLAMTARDFLNHFADRNLSDTVRQLPSDQQQAAREQVITDLAQRLGEATHSRINLQSQVIDVVVWIGNVQLQRIPEAGRTPLLIAIGVVLFLFITGFVFLFSWIISILSRLIFQLLLWLGFIKIGGEKKEVQVVTT